MSGYTVTMASVVERSGTTFSRSASDNNLLSKGKTKAKPPLTLNQGQHQRTTSLHSQPGSPGFEIPTFDSDFDFDTKLSLQIEPPSASSNIESERNEYSTRAPTTAPVAQLDQPAPIICTEEVPDEPQTTQPFAPPRTNSLIERPRSWLPNSRGDDTPPRPTTATADLRSETQSSELEESKSHQRTLSVSDTLASFTKRSWMSKSRSPSPGHTANAPSNKGSNRDRSASAVSTKLSKTRKRPGLTAEQAEKNRSTDSLRAGFLRASNYFSKMKQKPMGLGKLNTNTDSDNSCASSSTSLAPPNSTDTRTSQSFCESNTTITDDSSSEMPPRSRDALWSTFKTLEAEHKSFLSKQTGQRMAQAQQVLVPFLRNTSNHESVKQLHPEDVDRRATILNKWWITILEMLEGQGPQPVPGVDRPVLLESATMIMMRPEWRQTTSYFLPLVDRSPYEKVRARSWTNSSDSTESEAAHAAFIAESAEHNVRTMFVTNLVRQMAFVVDKMSLRHAPLSLVNFAGKACAYAFFFAPGVAEILLRLWGLTPELVRRVAEQFGLPKRNRGESEDIVALFPPQLGMFGWTSPRGLWECLKQIPKLPMLVARIPWMGPWVARWKGRDTDLFYIFFKYYHVLADQFMPPGLPLIEKARAPAFALVTSQLLSLVDDTIHRQNAMNIVNSPPLVDSQHGADAAMTLPTTQSNVLKGMADNRLIVLLKDVLSDDSGDVPSARHTFAEVFAAMMKAATGRTSQFNHSACFTLCDFLEEALVVYSDFEALQGGAKYTDWGFWVDVCKKILSSHNTMSEVRLLSFIFMIWNSITRDPQQKEMICMDFLLTEETFNAFFNHWCPMVRAYYHRLLCWRICRDTGKPNDLDSKIFLVALTRLKTSWSHFLYLQQSAAKAGRFGPSTAPVHPAPGKKFMIIRQEVNTPQPGLFLGFDSFARSFGNEQMGGNAFGDESGKGDRKRWSLFRKVLSLGGSQSDEDEGDQRGRTGNAPLPPPKAVSEDDSFCSSPVFEDQKFVFKFILSWQQPGMPPRDRVLTRPRLPSPAQARVSSQVRSDSPAPPAPSSPAPTRTFSGSQQAGLISGAKNASPLASPTSDGRPRKLSLKLGRVSSWESDLSFSKFEGNTSPITATAEPQPAPVEAIPTPEPEQTPAQILEGATQPKQPVGFYAKNSVYIGRALAEWGGVVFECNNFLERRRDEGIMGLSEIEVPLLGVDGFRRPGP